MSQRRRLDAELFRRRMAPSREAARRMVIDGQVLVGGALAEKPARQVLPSDDLRLLAPPPPFVSRAGGKLEGALERFGIDPGGLVCLDVGSSTGGFTDCLLQRHAKSVYAVDVGTNQLHEKIRADARVVVREQTDIRTVTTDDLAEPIDLVVGDVSFISLQRVLPTLIGLTGTGVDLLLLIKPQFEAGRREASKGRGVISDPVIWRRVIGEVATAAEAGGAAMLDLMTSPVAGSSGNIEFVGHFCVGADPVPLGPMIDAALEAAAEAGR